MKDSKVIASAFSSLAHPSRVDIFKCLLAHSPTGLNAGHLSSKTELPPSTLSHHLREMEAGGVVVRTVEGRRTVITLDLSNLITIANTLMHLCCAGESSNINLTKRSR